MTDVATQNAVAVDYSKSHTEIFEYVTIQLMRLQNDLSILEHVEGPESMGHSSVLPSWVPDYSVPFAGWGARGQNYKSWGSFYHSRPRSETLLVSNVVPRILAFDARFSGRALIVMVNKKKKIWSEDMLRYLRMGLEFTTEADPWFLDQDFQSIIHELSYQIRERCRLDHADQTLKEWDNNLISYMISYIARKIALLSNGAVRTVPDITCEGDSFYCPEKSENVILHLRSNPGNSDNESDGIIVREMDRLHKLAESDAQAYKPTVRHFHYVSKFSTCISRSNTYDTDALVWESWKDQVLDPSSKAEGNEHHIIALH